MTQWLTVIKEVAARAAPLVAVLLALVILGEVLVVLATVNKLSASLLSKGAPPPWVLCQQDWQSGDLPPVRERQLSK